MLRFLVEKEFKQMLRNAFLPRLIVMFPLIGLLVFPLAADFEIKGIRLVAVDNDHSSYSRRLVDKVVSSGWFSLARVEGAYDDAIRLVELGTADVILELPPHFERDLIREKTAGVMISADTVNGTKGGLGSAYLSGIVSDFASEIRGELIAGTPKPVVPAFTIIPRFRYNPHLKYPISMVPALMVMVLSMLAGFLPALNIVAEKESGTIEQMNVTPVRKFDFILSKLIPYWVAGFISLSICFVVARVFYGMIPAGNLATIYLFASVFVLAMSGFGLVISNYALSIQQAMFMMFFFVMTFILMSGLYTPIAGMPAWAQMMSNFSPLKYFIRVMRLVYLKGSGFSELASSFAALGGFAVFFNVWAVISYRKSA